MLTIERFNDPGFGGRFVMDTAQEDIDTATTVVTVSLGSALEREQCAAILQTLLNALNEAAVVEIDAADIVQIATCGVQVLHAASKLARDRQVDLRIIAPSAAFIDAFELAGIEEYDYMSGKVGTA
jgi:anti-anti-sigma regulatory factor